MVHVTNFVRCMSCLCGCMYSYVHASEWICKILGLSLNTRKLDICPSSLAGHLVSGNERIDLAGQENGDSMNISREDICRARTHGKNSDDQGADGRAGLDHGYNYMISTLQGA